MFASDKDAVEAIGAAAGARSTTHHHSDGTVMRGFLQAKTRIAGEILQKFVTYHKAVVILGNIESQLNESAALRDFVRECNRGRDIWFLTGRAELDEKLSKTNPVIGFQRHSVAKGQVCPKPEVV